jgi:hypothetical protein
VDVHPAERADPPGRARGSEGGVIRTNCGPELVAKASWAEVEGPIDTLLVVGGWSRCNPCDDTAPVGDVGGLPARRGGWSLSARRPCILAEGVLLAGRRATTHWVTAVIGCLRGEATSTNCWMPASACKPVHCPPTVGRCPPVFQQRTFLDVCQQTRTRWAVVQSSGRPVCPGLRGAVYCPSQTFR